jgi:hypothetical protein
MEVKFWAGLTDAQPMQYLEALRGHEGALLVVLAPDRRLAALREEFFARCAGTALAATRESEFLLDCGGIRLVLVAWTQLTHELVGAASGDPKVRGDVEQLRGLCSLIDEEDSFSMSREELSDVGSAMRVGMLNRLVDATVDRLVGGGLADTRNLKVTPQKWGYGRYIRLPHMVTWLGVDNDSWARFGRGPLWAIVSADHVQRLKLDSALRDWINELPARVYRDDEDGRLLIPLPVQPGAVKEESIAGFVEFFDDLARALDAACVPRTDWA